jgi:hypothetical protein
MSSVEHGRGCRKLWQREVGSRADAASDVVSTLSSSSHTYFHGMIASVANAA